MAKNSVRTTGGWGLHRPRTFYNAIKLRVAKPYFRPLVRNELFPGLLSMLFCLFSVKVTFLFACLCSLFKSKTVQVQPSANQFLCRRPDDILTSSNTLKDF